MLSLNPNLSGLLAITVLCIGVSRAEEVSQFRGPDGNGRFVGDLPNRWSDSENLGWSVGIPGGGWSSPVIAGDLVFVTTAVAADKTRPKGFGEGVQSMRSFYQSKAPSEPYSFEVHCVKLATGELAWKKQVISRKPPFKVHPSNSYATESPVTDGTHVYAYFAAVGVVSCLNLDGEEIWKRELGAFPTSNDFGTGSSLAYHDGMVFVQCDQEQSSFVCGLNAKTGAEIWRNDRSSRTSWSSPVIWNNDVRSELVTCGSGAVTSYDPASGDVLWQLTGIGGSFSASPTFDRQRIYLGQSGRTSRGPLVAINAGAEGELSYETIGEKALAWIQDLSAPSMCSPVVLDGRVYVLSRGIISCHDAETGESLYKKRLKDASSVTASLWAAGNNVFALNESGETSVITSGDEFKLEGTNSIDGLFWSTPAGTSTELLIRSSDKLYCIRK